ncbi:MAG TPA: helix-turn-helix domain-containing protein, partial [Aggregatilineales bacterium]|nr:helix-turn-helix domain-containing protein [Aggregatilineales bacterium]
MDLQNALTELGFTEYEAKVYLALVADYPATGYQISKKSGVPRSMVYETLSRLSARGAVMESVEGRSTRYRPLPPEVLLDHHEHEYRRRLSDLREGLHSLYTAS